MTATKPRKQTACTTTKTRSLRIPKMRHHKLRDLAFVEVAGKRHYLGPWGADSTDEAYRRFIAEYATHGPKRPDVDPRDITVAEVVSRFIDYLERTLEGRNRENEMGSWGSALYPLADLYGRTPAETFGLAELATLRRHFIDNGARGTACYKTVNAKVHRVRRMFRWAGGGRGEALISPDVHARLRVLENLTKRRREGAKPSTKRGPALDWAVWATMRRLPPTLAAMVYVHRFTGMRSADLCNMTPADIDRSGDAWTYTPAEFKSDYIEGETGYSFVFDKAVQVVLRPYIERRAADAPVFSPADAMEERRALAAKNRATPLSCGNRRGTKCTKAPKWKPTDRFTSRTYGQAVARACADAGVPAWTPHQLRHSLVTEVRRKYGLDAAQAVAGHRNAKMTEHYAEVSKQWREKVARDRRARPRFVGAA